MCRVLFQHLPQGRLPPLRVRRWNSQTGSPDSARLTSERKVLLGPIKKGGRVSVQTRALMVAVAFRPPPPRSGLTVRQRRWCAPPGSQLLLARDASRPRCGSCRAKRAKAAFPPQAQPRRASRRPGPASSAPCPALSQPAGSRPRPAGCRLGWFLTGAAAALAACCFVPLPEELEDGGAGAGLQRASG